MGFKEYITTSNLHKLFDGSQFADNDRVTMNFPDDDAGLHDSDLERVFRYSSQETTVLRLLSTDAVRADFA